MNSWAEVFTIWARVVSYGNYVLLGPLTRKWDDAFEKELKLKYLEEMCSPSLCFLAFFSSMLN